MVVDNELANDMVRQVPYLFNYSTIVTKENAPRLYRLGRSALRWLKAIVMWMLAAVAFWFIMVLPYDPGRSTGSLLIILPFIVLMAIEIGYYIVKLVREGNRADTI